MRKGVLRRQTNRRKMRRPCVREFLWLPHRGAQQGIQVVDYHSLLAAADGENYIPALTVDGVHPSAAGYAVMTPRTEQALQAAMAANTP